MHLKVYDAKYNIEYSLRIKHNFLFFNKMTEPINGLNGISMSNRIYESFCFEKNYIVTTVIIIKHFY